jgi:hypothetical protein
VLVDRSLSLIPRHFVGISAIARCRHDRRFPDTDGPRAWCTWCTLLDNVSVAMQFPERARSVTIDLDSSEITAVVPKSRQMEWNRGREHGSCRFDSRRNDHMIFYYRRRDGPSPGSILSDGIYRARPCGSFLFTRQFLISSSA